MTIKIGPKGYVTLQSAAVGPRREVKVVSFVGVAANGPVAGQHFPVNASNKTLHAVIDMNTGLNVSTYFRDTGSIAGNIHLTQTDTGIADNLAGHTFLAFICDTGATP
jgi:hypothetical protein